ncbi:hypothetical protein HIM_04772 [Hirsutella minnesotensis 3608]|uniref:Uncharacterized protein n=1 Tax=Hirsutella minnesotensis 3608 TaxID=1043627 RepID=A0A0F7ZV40_9HYPO|nr:hypothetical protein HIM_04772 [Hirsutella minnesotensis 3608]
MAIRHSIAANLPKKHKNSPLTEECNPVSNCPSYHTIAQFAETAPPYSPGAVSSPPSSPPARRRPANTRPQSIGLPPIPPLAPQSIVTLHNFRAPSWSANNAPAARQYRNVAERRTSDARYQTANDPTKRHRPSPQPTEGREGSPSSIRPLEDPYLVGEVAAQQARQERLARESGDDILLQEDRQWDWMLAHMRDWDERPRGWARFRRDTDSGQRKKLLHRIGGRLLS